MTTANIINTCKSAGMIAACYYPTYADSNCTLLNSGAKSFDPMSDVICNSRKAPECRSLQNVFVYMTKKEYYGEGGYESLGVIRGQFKTGRDEFDRFALCIS